jgi:hypothetical protein
MRWHVHSRRKGHLKKKGKQKKEGKPVGRFSPDLVWSLFFFFRGPLHKGVCRVFNRRHRAWDIGRGVINSGWRTFLPCFSPSRCSFGADCRAGRCRHFPIYYCPSVRPSGPFLAPFWLHCPCSMFCGCCKEIYRIVTGCLRPSL